MATKPVVLLAMGVGVGVGVGVGIGAGMLGCDAEAHGGCNADENGTSGGVDVIELQVDDTGFTVGSFDAGPGEPNITTENSATVTLALTNVGTRPHDFVIQCLATPSAMGCPAQSCFPMGADIPALQPGDHASVTFVTPVHEGSYTFTSDLPGDSRLVGAFVLM